MRQERRTQCSPGMCCCDSAAIPQLCFFHHTKYRYTHTRLMKAHTQQPSRRAVNPTVRCRGSHLERSPIPSQVSLSIFNACLRMRARRGEGEGASILFRSAVCMVCRHELDRACVASGPGGLLAQWAEQGTVVSAAVREEHTECHRHS